MLNVRQPHAVATATQAESIVARRWRPPRDHTVKGNSAAVDHIACSAKNM